MSSPQAGPPFRVGQRVKIRRPELHGNEGHTHGVVQSVGGQFPKYRVRLERPGGPPPQRYSRTGELIPQRPESIQGFNEADLEAA